MDDTKTWADLDEANKADGHYRRRNTTTFQNRLRALPHYRELRADLTHANKHYDKLLADWASGKPVSREMVDAYAWVELCDGAMDYLHLLADSEECGCHPGLSSECLLCRLSRRYGEWLRHRNANQET